MHNQSKFLTSKKSNTAPKIQHNISIKSLFKTGSNEPKIMQNRARYDQTDRLQSQQVRRKIPEKQGKLKNSPWTVENEFSGTLYIKLKLESSSFTSKNSFQKCSVDCSQFWKQWVSQNSVFRAISSKMHTMSSKLSSKILAI